MAAADGKNATTAKAAAKIDSSKWVVGKTDDIRKSYKLGRNLGQPGQFGYAVLAVHNQTNEKRAVKVISKSRFARLADRQYHFEQLRNEVGVMRAMQHKNIIRLFDVYEDEKDLYLVLELCTGGELFDRIKAQGNYSEKDASAVLRQCFEGVKYMHDQKPPVAHCDLKPDNFLFLSPAKDSTLKIIDFGMSKFVARRKYFEALSGTPYYVAPEVLNGRYSEHCDIWSLGVVMFVMLFGYPPFYADQEQHGAMTDEVIFQLVKKGFEPEVKDGYGAHFPKAIPVTDSARDLMSRLLVMDHAKRISATEALEHPWLTGEAADDKPLVASVLTNLTNFNANHKFKQHVLTMMADMMTESEVSELRKTFQAIDSNGDGNITVEELKGAFEKWGTDTKTIAAKDQIESLMKLADVNGDGCLSYEELLMTAVQRKLKGKEERLWEAFCKFDQNGDGKISREEIVAVLGTSPNAQELIAEADVNGDGTIDYEEFLNLWSAKHEVKKPEAKAPAAGDQKKTADAKAPAAAAKNGQAAAPVAAAQAKQPAAAAAPAPKQNQPAPAPVAVSVKQPAPASAAKK
jgi:calcium-dependent protein kinase